MIRFALPGILLALLATPAAATEWTICSSKGGEASFSVLVGSLGIGTANEFKVEQGGRMWSTTSGEGTPITRGQAFEDDRTILIDVMTEDMGTVVAELRAFKAREGDQPVAIGGILRMPGVGSWSVACDGGEG
ncbi:MAG: hypothetical protein JNM45_03810 [Rhizobiales bacterium]|nr:hypothetical protein [Hyphomicrobiales bacterium]